MNIYIKQLFVLFFLFCSGIIYAAEDQKKIKIIGNENIDEEIIYSMISDKFTDLSENNLNDIIKLLYSSGYFKDVEAVFLDNQINIIIKENPRIKNISFTGNKRFNNEEIFEIFSKEEYFTTFNEYKINQFMDDLKNIYMSYGYNLIKLEYKVDEEIEEKNIVNINFIIDEGKISKVNKIYFIGNSTYTNFKLLSLIKSKQQNLFRILGSENFKNYQIKNDRIKLLNFYKNNGFKDIKIDMQTEFISNKNKFNVYFYINEGEKYFISSITFNLDNFKIKEMNKKQLIKLKDEYISKKIQKSNFYSPERLNKLKDVISSYLYSIGSVFFKLTLYEKIEGNNIDFILQIADVEPKYVNQINIFGNTRTKDKVIRREIEFAEGDSVNKELIRLSNQNINNLGFFKNVTIKEVANNEKVDVIVNVEEQTTGQFNVGLALDSFNGVTFMTGLNEKNIMGEGRNIDVTIDTSANNTNYNFGIIEPYIFNKNLDLIYNINFRDRDYSKSSSYTVTSFNTNFGFQYLLSENLKHTATIEYQLKDYEITDSSTASDSVKKLSGNNAVILLNNDLAYNKLDSYLRPSEGSYFSIFNVFSPSTNDTNGYIKNTISYRKYINYNKNILSVQSKIANIFSLQNEEIPTDDKFALGGRWLRGFDNYGAGPRNSRSSYVGGNNLFVTKLDLQRPLTGNSDNPIDLDLFFDFGTVFDNKVTPTDSKESIRSSYGFGFKFYSPIGPIGISWGYPLTKESYDIERMFNFSIGNLN